MGCGSVLPLKEGRGRRSSVAGAPSPTPPQLLPGERGRSGGPGEAVGSTRLVPGGYAPRHDAPTRGDGLVREPRTGQGRCAICHHDGCSCRRLLTAARRLLLLHQAISSPPARIGGRRSSRRPLITCASRRSAAFFTRAIVAASRRPSAQLRRAGDRIVSSASRAPAAAEPDDREAARRSCDGREPARLRSHSVCRWRSRADEADDRQRARHSTTLHGPSRRAPANAPSTPPLLPRRPQPREGRGTPVHPERA